MLHVYVRVICNGLARVTVLPEMLTVDVMLYFKQTNKQTVM